MMLTIDLVVSLVPLLLVGEVLIYFLAKDVSGYDGRGKHVKKRKYEKRG